MKDFNFEAGILTVHGKGKKDRTVPLPEAIVPELISQLEVVKNIHDEDLAAGYAGVFLNDRTIRTLLGHSDVRTTMIYTH